MDATKELMELLANTITIKKEPIDSEDSNAIKVTNNDNNILLSTLRKYSEQFPKQTASASPIHMPNVEEQEPNVLEEMKKLAALSPMQLAAKIEKLYDDVFQLGLREAEEMKRGKNLGIFNEIDRKK